MCKNKSLKTRRQPSVQHKQKNMQPFKRKVTGESPHTFFVTHWGANASMNPSPAISRTMPVKRPIRSWTPRYVNHFHTILYYTSSKYPTRYAATRKKRGCNKNQLQNLIIVHISQSQNLGTALRMSNRN